MTGQKGCRSELYADFSAMAKCPCVWKLVARSASGAVMYRTSAIASSKKQGGEQLHKRSPKVFARMGCGGASRRLLIGRSGTDWVPVRGSDS